MRYFVLHNLAIDLLDTTKTTHLQTKSPSKVFAKLSVSSSPFHLWVVNMIFTLLIGPQIQNPLNNLHFKIANTDIFTYYLFGELFKTHLMIIFRLLLGSTFTLWRVDLFHCKVFSVGTLGQNWQRRRFERAALPARGTTRVYYTLKWPEFFITYVCECTNFEKCE